MEKTIQGAEVFIPKLIDGITRFPIDDGRFLVCEPSGQYSSVSAAQNKMIDLIDGSRSLSAILREYARSGGMPSVRKLISLIHQLYRHDMLANSPEELVAYGFLNLERRREPLGAVLRLFFGTRIALPLAKRLGVSAAKVLGIIPMPTWLLGLVVIGILIFASAVGLAPLNQVFGDAGSMSVSGRAGLGVLSIYVGCWLALVSRMLFRIWALGVLQVRPHTIGIQIPLLVLAPYVDGRRAKRRGRAAEVKLSLAGICGVAVATLLSLIGVALLSGAHAQICGLMTVGALCVFLAVICPFANTDVGRVLDAMYPGGNGRVHLTQYLQHRYFSRLVSGNYFAGERHLLFMAVVNIAWFYLCLKYFAGVFVELILPTISNRFDGGEVLDVVLATSFAFVAGSCLVATVLFFVFTLYKICLDLLPSRSTSTSVPRDVREIDRALSVNPILSRISVAGRSDLATKIRCLQYSAGMDIVRQGERGETFYILLDGEADVMVSAASGAEERVAKLVAGQCFGEQALIEDETRNATVRARGVVRVFELDRTTFLEVLKEASLDLQSVTGLIRLAQAIRRSPVFEDLSPSAMHSLQESLTRVSHQKGEVIFEQGAVGDRFYLVETGSLSVLSGQPCEQIATLGSGDFFGELALLYDSPRNATICSTEDGELLFLDRAQFRDIMSRDFVSFLSVQDLAISRIQGGM